MVQRALLIVGTLAMVALAGAQPAQQEEAEGSDLIISVESNLVVVPLHVYRKKSSVNGLGREAFELLEDGVPQNIAFVEGPPADGEVSQRSIPTEIIFLIDFSYSVMTPGLLDFNTIRSTMLEGLRQDVQISVYGFAARLKVFTGPTRDLRKLQRALDQSIESEAGGSRVYEAIMQTARHASSRGGNVSRMMIVFSDGLSTTNLDPELVVRSANAFGIPIYPVVLGGERIRRRALGLPEDGGIGFGRQPNDNRQPNPGGLGGGRQDGARRGEPQVLGPRQQPQGQLNRQSNVNAQRSLQQVFAEIGPKTGGRSYELPVINNRVIRQILGSLSTLAETEYVVGYYPSAVDEELTAHAVEVRLRSEEFGQLYGGRRFVVH